MMSFRYNISFFISSLLLAIMTMTNVPLINPNALNLHTKLLSFGNAAICLLAHHLHISIAQAQLLNTHTAYIFPMLMERHLLTGSGDKLQVQKPIIQKRVDIHTLPNLAVRHFELGDDVLNALAKKTTVPLDKIQTGFDMISQLYLYVVQTLFTLANLNRADKLEFFKIQRLFWQDEQTAWATMLKIDQKKPLYQVSDHYKKLGGARKRFDDSQWALPNHAWLFEMIDIINQLPPLKIGHAITATQPPATKAQSPWLTSIMRHKTALIATLIFVGIAAASLAFFDKKTAAPAAAPKAVPQDIAIVRTDDSPSDDHKLQAQNSDTHDDKSNKKEMDSPIIAASKQTSDNKPSANKKTPSAQSSKKSEQSSKKSADNKKDDKAKKSDQKDKAN